MLGPKPGLRVAPVPAPSGAALALRCAPRRPEGVGTRGVPTINPWPPARVEQGAGQGSKQAREEGSSIRGRWLRVGVLRAVPCRNPEQVLPTRLDDGPGMAGHGLPGTGVLPQRNGGKAQAGGDDRQDQATDGPASDAELPSPGQHPPLQLVQAPAHPGSPVCLIVRVGYGSGHGKSGIVRCRRVRTWPVNALGASHSDFGALSASDYRPRGKQPLAALKTARWVVAGWAGRGRTAASRRRRACPPGSLFQKTGGGRFPRLTYRQHIHFPLPT